MYTFVSPGIRNQFAEGTKNVKISLLVERVLFLSNGYYISMIYYYHPWVLMKYQACQLKSFFIDSKKIE